MDEQVLTGGCLCGQVRYAARGAPTLAGHCYCGDCRKASGGGFIAFMGYPAERLEITGETLRFTSPSARGTDAVRNSCTRCGSLVFGGILGVDTSHTIYAGTLDDPAAFTPTVAIFAAGRPAWATIPAGLQVFARMPG